MYRYLIVLFFVMSNFVYAQKGQPDIAAVQSMPQGLPKVKATQELLRQYNLPAIQLNTLVTENLKFTSTPAMAVEKAKLLLAYTYYLINIGRKVDARTELEVVVAHVKLAAINDPELFIDIASAYVLIGEPKLGQAYLTQAAKTRGKTTIGGLLAAAKGYTILGKTAEATEAIKDAEGLYGIDTPAPSETGHILCQLIIQSVRLKRYKELDKYYEQLKLLANYNSEFEYILAHGLYFEYKKNLKVANADFETLADAFLKGRQNEQTLEGVIRLGALLSLQRYETAANKYFDIARKALTASLLIQPIGKVFTALHQEHVVRYKGMSDLDALMAKSPTLDSAYTNEVISGLQYQLSVILKQSKIDSLQQAKQVADLKINREKQRNWLITLSLILMLSIAFIVIYIFYQRRKRTILLFKAEKERTESLHKQELSKMLANAQEQERSKIAEKLHDEIGSMLAVVRLNLSVPENATSGLTDSQLNTANKVLNDVADTVREMSHELMPVLIQKMGLKKAVEQLVEDINTAGKLQVESVIIGVDETLERYDYEFKVNIYRIIQELFHNILKHSKASNVTFQLIQHPSELNILVEDNGVGMSKGKDAEGKGMKLISARVSSYQGKLTVESNPDAGTIVIVDIPFQNSPVSV